MEIVRKSLKEGAAEARGLAVIIDVFRAFSCQPLFYHLGASRVILETDPQRAREMRQQNPDYILVGEVNEVPMEGADLGNSPAEIIKKGQEFFAGKTVVHRTTAGVTGAVAAFAKAEEVVLASFMTAGAVARYIRGKNPSRLTLVGMGDRANKPAPEDEACADYIEHLVTGKPYDAIDALRRIVFQVTAQKFLVGGKEYLPREDPIFCFQRDLFDFVLKVRKEGDLLEVFQVKTLYPEQAAPGGHHVAKEEISASQQSEKEANPPESSDKPQLQGEEDQADAGEEAAREETKNEETGEGLEKDSEAAGAAEGKEKTEEADSQGNKDSKKKKKASKKGKKKSSS